MVGDYAPTCGAAFAISLETGSKCHPLPNPLSLEIHLTHVIRIDPSYSLAVNTWHDLCAGLAQTTELLAPSSHFQEL